MNTSATEKEFYANIGGVRLRIYHTVVDPEKPTLVFLHESFGCISHWKGFPQKLGDMSGCNVLVYDRQGYGLSDPFTIEKRQNSYLEEEAVVLNELLTELRVKEAILFGHSDGGSIALIAAAQYPEKIKAVITEGAHVFVEEITLRGIRIAVGAYKESGLRDKLMRYHGDKTDKVFSMWADTWLSEEFGNWNIEHFLPAITCPVLAIQGERDEYGSIEQVESITGKPAGATSRFMPAAGHTPHREAEEATAQKAADFICSLTVG